MIILGYIVRIVILFDYTVLRVALSIMHFVLTISFVPETAMHFIFSFLFYFQKQIMLSKLLQLMIMFQKMLLQCLFSAFYIIFRILL